MKFGLLLGGAPDEVTSGHQYVHECLALTEKARASGFHSIAVSQHFLSYPRLYLQPVPLLARLAAETGDSMQLITGILLLPLLQPIEVAEQIATLDNITGGRLIMGVGAGYRADEFTSFGVSIADRAKRQVEALTLIRLLWTENRVDFAGEFYQVHGTGCGVRPLQRPHPPTWMAGLADGAVKRAARHADAWYGYVRASLDTLERQLQLFTQTRSDTGLPLPMELPVRRDVYLTSNSEAAWARAEALIAPRMAVNDEWGLTNDLPSDSLQRGSFQDFARGRVIVGDPTECVEEINRYRSRIGNLHMVVRLRWPGMSLKETLGSIELFGREVIARF